MIRGDIYWVDLDPVVGSEADKTRPAIIVSSNGANARAAMDGRGVITVVPLTSNTDNVYAFQVFVPSSLSGLDYDSKAQAEQVRSVAIERIDDPIGSLTPELLKELDDALRLHLALGPVGATA